MNNYSNNTSRGDRVWAFDEGAQKPLPSADLKELRRPNYWTKHCRLSVGIQTQGSAHSQPTS